MADKRNNKESSGKQIDRLEVYANIEESVEAIVSYDLNQFFWRSIAITLLIGHLAIIGFFLGAKPEELPFSVEKACLWVGLIFICFNFCIIWLDLFKEEKLSLSCIHNILMLERKNKWLFPIFENTTDEEGRRHGAVEKKIHFYIKCGNNIVLISAVAALYSTGLETSQALRHAVAICICASIIVFLHSLFLMKTFIKVENFAERFLSQEV